MYSTKSSTWQIEETINGWFSLSDFIFEAANWFTCKKKNTPNYVLSIVPVRHSFGTNSRTVQTNVVHTAKFYMYRLRYANPTSIQRIIMLPETFSLGIQTEPSCRHAFDALQHHFPTL